MGNVITRSIANGAGAARASVAARHAARARSVRAALALSAALTLLTPAAALARGRSTTAVGTNVPATQALGASRTPATRSTTSVATTTTPAVATTTSVPTISTPQPAGTPLTVTPPTRTAVQTHKKSGGRRISTGVAIIAALAALLALGAAAWALARRFAYEPTWWLGMRHSVAEASFRTSATWAELRDWARIGR